MPKYLIFISILFFTTINIVKAQDNESSSDDVFVMIERPATFKGGNAAMEKFINANLTYPKKALKRKTEGKIIVSMLIDKEGNVTEPKVVRGEELGNGLPEEALRIVSLMPQWTPASSERKPEPRKIVSAVTTVTINFNLEKYNKK